MKKREKLLKILPLVLFGFLALCIHASFMSRFESWVYHRAVIRMTPVFTNALKLITRLGDTTEVLVFCLLLIAIKRTRKTIAFPVSLAVISSTMLNAVLKNVFARQRPNILRLVNESSYSFPSGHAMITATLYTMLILLAFWFLKSSVLKTIVTAICLFMILAIGFSRIYLGVHYVDDVIAGWLIGFNVAVRVYFYWDIRQTRLLPEPEQVVI